MRTVAHPHADDTSVCSYTAPEEPPHSPLRYRWIASEGHQRALLGTGDGRKIPESVGGAVRKVGAGTHPGARQSVIEALFSPREQGELRRDQGGGLPESLTEMTLGPFPASLVAEGLLRDRRDRVRSSSRFPVDLSTQTIGKLSLLSRNPLYRYLI